MLQQIGCVIQTLIIEVRLRSETQVFAEGAAEMLGCNAAFIKHERDSAREIDRIFQLFQKVFQPFGNAVVFGDVCHRNEPGNHTVQQETSESGSNLPRLVVRQHGEGLHLLYQVRGF